MGTFPSHARGVLNPNSERRRMWDVLMFVLLLFAATVTPFEIAFVKHAQLDALFFLNRIVDLCFIADLCANFFTGYFNVELGVWVTSKRAIARRCDGDHARLHSPRSASSDGRDCCDGRDGRDRMGDAF